MNLAVDSQARTAIQRTNTSNPSRKQLFGGYAYTDSWIARFALVGAVLQKAWF